jgi:hypothetical protein
MMHTHTHTHIHTHTNTRLNPNHRYYEPIRQLQRPIEKEYFPFDLRHRAVSVSHDEWANLTMESDTTMHLPFGHFAVLQPTLNNFGNNIFHFSVSVAMLLDPQVRCRRCDGLSQFNLLAVNFFNFLTLLCNAKLNVRTQLHNTTQGGWYPPLNDVFIISGGGTIKEWNKEFLNVLLPDSSNVHLVGTSHQK